MGKNETAGEYVLRRLSETYGTEELDIGADARLDKGLMHFTVRRFRVKDIGNLCLLNMSGMFGLMKMETVVLACDTRDVPLINLDTVKAMGNTTLLMELYDTRIAKSDNTLETACQAIKDRDKDLPDYESGEHWYDGMLYRCSWYKKAKGQDARFMKSCRDFFDAFMNELARADVCDPAVKREKNRVLPQGLLEHGGPAVDRMRKMFGDELAKRLVLGHMYGLDGR